MRETTLVLAIALIITLLPYNMEVRPVAAAPTTTFLWGAAVSSYQVEGGIHCLQPSSFLAPFTSWTQAVSPGVPCNDYDFFNGNSTIRDRVARDTSIAGPSFTIEPAGYADRFWEPAYYERDFDNAQMLGLNSFRISLEWSRIEPSRGVYDQNAIAAYRQMLIEMHKRGLTPIVTLHHFTLPIWELMPPQTVCVVAPCGGSPDDGYISSNQGWDNPATVTDFVDYVNHVVPVLKDLVDYWLTVNEPVASQVEAGYVGDVWSPGFLLDGPRSKAALFNLVSAHARAYDAIKAIYAQAPPRNVTVGVAEAMGAVVPAQNLVSNVVGDNSQAANNFDYFVNDFFVNAVVNGMYDQSYLDTINQVHNPTYHPEFAHRLDFLGINYYRRFHVWHDNILALSGTGFVGGAFNNNLYGDPEPHGLLNDMGWEIYPQGLYDMIMKAKNNWSIPVLITENGIPERNDRNRAPFIIAHLQQVQRAMQDGATVLGYQYWSLMDNWELQSNYTHEAQFGLFHVDRGPVGPDGKPILHRELTEGALAYQQLILESEAAGGTGAPTTVALNIAQSKFGTITSDGAFVVPPTRTQGRYWQGSGINVYLGNLDTDSSFFGLIAYGTSNLDWHRVQLLHDGRGWVMRETWFDDASETTLTRDHIVTYSVASGWRGNYLDNGVVHVWAAAPVVGAGLWQWAAGSSPWGGGQFYVGQHEGQYDGKYLTFATIAPAEAKPIGPEWRELNQVGMGTLLHLQAGDADPANGLGSLGIFNLNLSVSGSTATTTVSNSGEWAGSKAKEILDAPFGYTGYIAHSGDWIWTANRTDSPSSTLQFLEQDALFRVYPANPPVIGGIHDQYWKEHDPTSVMPLDDFTYTPLQVVLGVVTQAEIKFQAGGRAYDLIAGAPICAYVTCTGTWTDIGGRVATRLSEQFPPLVNLGPDFTVEANASGGAYVTLDGSSGFDVGGLPLTYSWTGDFATTSAMSPTVFLGLSASGGPAVHRTCLTVSNGVRSATSCVNIKVVDTTPPTIKCGIADGVWHATDVSIGCSASDIGSGLAQPSDAAFALSTHVPALTETSDAWTDTRTVCDRAGNCAVAGPIKGSKVDKAPPVSTIVQPAAGDYLHTDTLTLNYSVADESGVLRYTVTLDGSTTVGGAPLTNGRSIDLLTQVPIGTHVFAIDAADGVGNEGVTTVTFQVIATAASIKTDVQRFAAGGEISKPGAAESLLAKLNAAETASGCRAASNIYQAFINEVEAQTGKAIDPQAAATLIGDANYLIQQCTPVTPVGVGLGVVAKL